MITYRTDILAADGLFFDLDVPPVVYTCFGCSSRPPHLATAFV